jgi:hypothetical protein
MKFSSKHVAIVLCSLGFVLVSSAQNLTNQASAVDMGKQPPAIGVRTAFQVKYVAMDTVYLSAGRSAGLTKGMQLTVKRLSNVSTQGSTGEGTGSEVVAELKVISVAETSAVCSIERPVTVIQAGDFAYLQAAEAELLAMKQSLGGTRKYPQVVTFTEGDPLEEEARDDMPRPPLPEINRVRGRLGFDYSATKSKGTAASSSYQTGVVFRADITRIFGTHWNLSGYWRGRLTASSSGNQQSLQDLINRTYQLSMVYDNPESHWVAGVGRMFIPWASSLETIDGGYFGRRLSSKVTAAMFAGSTPDPTSWSYDPNRRIAGGLVNFEGGSFDNVHFSSTSGLGVSALKWQIDRPFLFFENNLVYKRYVSIYQALQADNPKDSMGTTRLGPGLSRSFVTLRIQPHRRVSFDVNHNYFRDVPTFDPRLVGTGLLDKYLFQGLSGGVRVETWRQISLYTNIGRSNRSGDTRTSLNQLYGVTAGRIWKTGLRADMRYSTYDSSFGKGTYRALSLSRTLNESVRLELQAGRQSTVSTLSAQSGSRFLNALIDANLGSRYFIQGGFTAERGNVYDYDQWVTTVGYRFDNRDTKQP